MKRLETQTAISFTVNILLLVALVFLAFYFFIGKNLVYMSKTQNQINYELMYYFRSTLESKSSDVKLEDVLELARRYNVGVSIEGAKGIKNVSQEIDKKEMLLRLEFAGRIITTDITVNEEKTRIKLTYFRPYFSGDETIKFIPAGLRLVLLFTVFTVVLALSFSRINSSLIKSDLQRVQGFILGLTKGSYKNSAESMNYVELQELTNELNSLQSQILQREELKKRMSADFAHELRTPLTTLQSHLEAMIDGVWQPTQERMISCHEEIMRLIRLVGDLEKLSKIEDETISLQKSSFDLTELVKSIGTNFQGELSHKNISLIINGNEQEISADKDKISQVFVNLLSNSFKYTSRGGKVLVDISGDNKYINVILNDSGIGIPEKDLPNVFNRLYRSDLSRTRATGGAGIGLTIAKAIIDAHRGSIDIVSQEGLGTEITLILPR